MEKTQLVCTHCGSTLSFGGKVAAGTTVQCIICMKTFIAGNPVAVPASATPPTTGKPKPAAPPAAKSSPTATATKQPSTAAAPQPSSTAPTVAKAGSSGAIIAVVAALVLVTAGVLGFAAWKGISTGSNKSGDPDNPDNKQIAAKTKSESVKGNGGKSSNLKEIKKSEIPKKDDPPAKKDKSPKGDDEDPPIKDDTPVLKKKDTNPPPDKKTEAVEKKVEVKVDDKKPDEPKKPPVKLVGVTQKEIDATIDKGVAYLKKSQVPTGSWHHEHAVGHAALGGLTLLECKVPRDDASVQAAATFVRENVDSLTETYEISLAILFLDRLGETTDRVPIQGMALRILAAQDAGGAWGYNCRRLAPNDMYRIYSYLHTKYRPELLNPGNPAKRVAGAPIDPKRAPQDAFQRLYVLMEKKPAVEFKVKAGVGPGLDPKVPFLPPPGGKGPPILDPKLPLLPPPGGKGPPLVDPKNPLLPPAGGKLPPGGPGDLPPIDPLKPPVKPPIGGGGFLDPSEMLPYDFLPTPMAQAQGKKKGEMAKVQFTMADNSNTQFAMLALWAARRHDIPVDHSLIFAYQRFAEAQNADGGWSYTYVGGIPQSTPTMTCVGALALAIGHGVAPETKKGKGGLFTPSRDDPAIRRGLQFLSRSIGQPSPKADGVAMDNIFFLWSVERVAVLYDLSTIEGKDWYSWGAQILVRNQLATGDWDNTDERGNVRYPGAKSSINTCFGLLFLRRSNLVQDLTQGLKLYSGVRE